MKMYIAFLCLAAALSGCASRASLEELAGSRAQVQRLQEQLDYQEKNAPGMENQTLVAQIKDAQARLDAAMAQVAKERAESKERIGEAVERGAEKAAPIANGVLPGLGGGLVVLAGLIRGMLGRKAIA